MLSRKSHRTDSSVSEKPSLPAARHGRPARPAETPRRCCSQVAAAASGQSRCLAREKTFGGRSMPSLLRGLVGDRQPTCRLMACASGGTTRRVDVRRTEGLPSECPDRQGRRLVCIGRTRSSPPHSAGCMLGTNEAVGWVASAIRAPMRRIKISMC